MTAVRDEVSRPRLPPRLEEVEVDDVVGQIAWTRAHVEGDATYREMPDVTISESSLEDAP